MLNKIYLASRSPRRRQLLQRLNVEFEIIDVAIDETWDGKEAAVHFVTRLALEKARAGRQKTGATAPVLAADTEVVLDGRLLGKPANRDDAVAMLQSLSGRSHDVYCAVALIDATETTALNISRVGFRPLTLEECQAYCATGEPYDKAGGYGIQGPAAAFVTRLRGSYSGVMGLPLTETAELLEQIK